MRLDIDYTIALLSRYGEGITLAKIFALAFIVLNLGACGAPTGESSNSKDLPRAPKSMEASPIDLPPKNQSPKTEANETTQESTNDSKAVLRRQITNNSDRLTREQANLARKEQLRDNTRTRRDQTQQDLAAIEKESGFSISISTGPNGVNSSNTNPGRTKAQLRALIEQQEREIATIESEIKAIREEIAKLEQANNELAQKL